MAVTFTTTMPGASPDYMKYLWERPVKRDRKNDSVFLDFALAPVDAGFVKLTRGAYIKINTTKYPNWFTGYVVNDPQLSYLGKKNGLPHWGYKYEATSDEYVLSLKPLGIIPPFLNMGWGDILAALVQSVMPNTFNVNGVQTGPVVAQYVVDPNKKFIDVVREACDATNYTFYANDKKLYFLPQDDTTIGLTLDRNDVHFTPANLELTPEDNQILNDITVIGDLEPQNHVQEYFVGTGLDASFPLVSSVFGADSAVLLDETFSGSINTAVWTVHDQPQGYLAVSNGYLNCLGGVGYNVSVQTTSPIPMEGRLRITHGEWDFLNGNDGLLGGLWTQTPNGSYTGCLYGLKVQGSTLYAIANGVLKTDYGIAIDTTKRYILRTIVEFTKANRVKQPYSFITQGGVVTSVASNTEADSAVWSTVVTEIDPADGSMVNQFWFRHDTDLTGVTDTFATYCLIASDGLSCTVTGVTISTPISATLETADIVELQNASFDDWDSDTQPSGWTASSGVYKEEQYSDDGKSLKLSGAAGSVEYVEQSVASLLKPNTTYNIFFRYQRGIGGVGTTAALRVKVVGTGYDEYVEIPLLLISANKWQTYSGAFVRTPDTIPPDAMLRVEFTVGAAANIGVWVDNIIVTSLFTSQLVGPNEIDALDGLSPIATITQSNTGADTKSTYFGTGQFNPGQSQLVFFKDSVTRTSSIPPKNQLIRLSYRSAGSAIGRVVSKTSVLSEGASWGDDGLRSIVKRDLSPRPRTSVECEMAAAAIVSENSFNHYKGSYKQFSNYFTKEPRSGGLVVFKNLDIMIPNLQAEEINEVTSTLEAADVFSHVISFGRPEGVNKLLKKFGTPVGVFQKDAGTSSLPTALEAPAIVAGSVTFPPELTNPSLIGWSSNHFYVNVGSDWLQGAGLFYEARYTDDGWGVDDGRNLIARTKSPIIAIPRSLRGRVFFLRQSRSGNYMKWSEDATKSVYSGGTRTLISGQGPDGLTKLTSVTLGANSPIIGTSESGASGTGCLSFSIKGPAGRAMTATYGSGSKQFTCTGYWQRVSVAGSGTTWSISCSQSVTFELTKVSVEYGTVNETVYVKTTDILYGPVSRYSTVVHVSFPAPVSLAAVDLSSLMIRPTY